MKICFIGEKSKQGQIFWHRVGVAFVEENGDITVRLRSLPVNGEFVIRDYVPKGAGSGSSGGGMPAGYESVGGGKPSEDDDDIPF